MSETPIDWILQQLRLREPEEAWTEFLQEYSTLIFSVLRHLEPDIDRASDCFQFVCEQLSNDSFRRLRRFKPEGPAKFSTWLSEVTARSSLHGKILTLGFSGSMQHGWTDFREWLSGKMAFIRLMIHCREDDVSALSAHS